MGSSDAYSTEEDDVREAGLLEDNDTEEEVVTTENFLASEVGRLRAASVLLASQMSAYTANHGPAGAKGSEMSS